MSKVSIVIFFFFIRFVSFYINAIVNHLNLRLSQKITQLDTFLNWLRFSIVKNASKVLDNTFYLRIML